MQTGTQFLLIVTLASVLFSCKKDKDGDGGGNKITKEKISGSYRLVSMMYKSGTSAPMDLMDYFDACEKDDITTLHNNNTYTVADAGAKCNPPGDDSGTWDLPNTTSIIIDGDTYTLKSFDGDKLVIQITDNSTGTTEEITITLDKQ